jgi:hypothetical protein
VYRVTTDEYSQSQVEALPPQARAPFAEACVVLEVSPWSGESLNAAIPDAEVRTLTFGPTTQAMITYLILEDQRRVDILDVPWLGRTAGWSRTGPGPRTVAAQTMHTARDLLLSPSCFAVSQGHLGPAPVGGEAERLARILGVLVRAAVSGLLTAVSVRSAGAGSPMRHALTRICVPGADRPPSIRRSSDHATPGGNSTYFATYFCVLLVRTSA